MSRSPRRVTLFTAMGSLGLILFAATVGRKEIATQYHLFRLRSDPAYLHTIVAKPEGTPHRAAVRKYVKKNEEGKVALFKECLEPSYIQDYVRDKNPYVYACVGVGIAPVDSVEYRTSPDGGWRSTWHPDKPEWLKLTHEYLTSHATFTFSQYPGITFEFVKLSDKNPSGFEGRRGAGEK